MFSDTSPEAERVQIELLRRATTAEKIDQMRSMTAMAVKLSRRAIARANPKLSSKEVDLKWVELHYGKELGRDLRNYLRDR